MDRLIHMPAVALSRFIRSGSIEIIEQKIITEKRTKPFVTSLNLPNLQRAQEIRKCWERDRRSLPRSGVVFPDGSILTIFIEICELPVPPAFKPIEDRIVFSDEGEPRAYVGRYSYCFYPNSEAAEYIGYFRYDFHTDSMGNGDLGKHSYFHLHHRHTGNGFRLSTGPVIEIDNIVSGIESILSPKTRKLRLEELFEMGKFSDLLFDMTVEGVVSMGEIAKQDKSRWISYKHKLAYEKFVERFR